MLLALLGLIPDNQYHTGTFSVLASTKKVNRKRPLLFIKIQGIGLLEFSGDKTEHNW